MISPAVLVRRLPAVPLRLAIVLLLLAGPALTGCSLFEPGATFASVAATPIAPDQTRLVVYRPIAGSLLEVVGGHPVAINGTPACRLTDEHFFVHEGPAGATTIADGASSLALTTEPGGQYFVRIALNPQRGSLVGWVSPMVSPLIGLGPDEPPPAPTAGLFAIETVDPMKASRDLASLTLDTDCH
jgi:hypothetical protein